MWEFKPNGNSLAEDMRDLFNYCTEEYKATLEGCECIVDTWREAKGDRFDERFKNIPGFDKENHCIVIDSKWIRTINPDAIGKFFDNIPIDCRQPYKVDGKTFSEWHNIYYYYKNLVNELLSLPAITVNANGLAWAKSEKMAAWGKYCDSNKRQFTKESEEEYGKRTTFTLILRSIHHQFFNEDDANKVNEIYPDLKAVSGQKASKVVRKWFKQTGLDATWTYFENEYAKYADAINPLETPELLVISWNPMDYLTMSFGTNWTSCHSIDKRDVHEQYDGYGGNYHGCYSSGTMSYMLDPTSVVVYSLRSNTTKPYWNNGKVRRQMFHISEDGKIVLQGRLYPDDQTDAGNSVPVEAYENWRAIMQNTVAQAFGLSNLWVNKKGTNETYKAVKRSYGTHYHDYEHYANCNVSYHTSIDIDNENERRTLVIGHNPICPSCGNEHSEEEWCTCGDCRGDEVRCARCGEYVDREDAYYIDGEWYCGDCTFWCEYHQERERESDDHTYVNGYGTVCDYGLDAMVNNGDVHECEQCGEYYHINDYRATDWIDPETGEVHFFCDDRCRDRWLDEHCGSD